MMDLYIVQRISTSWIGHSDTPSGIWFLSSFDLPRVWRLTGTDGCVLEYDLFVSGQIHSSTHKLKDKKTMTTWGFSEGT